MFTTQWNIENYFAPLTVWLTCEILKWFIVQIVEHIKKNFLGIHVVNFTTLQTHFKCFY